MVQANLPSVSRQELRSICAFSWAGGMALGVHRAGFRHVALIESGRNARAILIANAGNGRSATVGDWPVVDGDPLDAIEMLRPSQLPEIHLVAGSPPVLHTDPDHVGTAEEDPPNQFASFVDVVRRFRPRAFIVESAAVSPRPGFAGFHRYLALQLAYPGISLEPDEVWTNHFARLKAVDAVADVGWSRHGARYDVKARTLNAADFGVPQIRRRRFYVGFRGDLRIDWRFPEPTHLRDLLEFDQQSGAYWMRHSLPSPKTDTHANRNAMLPLLSDHRRPRPWRTVRDAIGDLPLFAADGVEDVLNHHLVPGAKVYLGHTGSVLDAPAKTLKGGSHGIPGGENTLRTDTGELRYLTVREAARLQRYPDHWRLDGSWAAMMRQLGNSVPVRLAHVLARSVADSLASGS